MPEEEAQIADIGANSTNVENMRLFVGLEIFIFITHVVLSGVACFVGALTGAWIAWGVIAVLVMLFGFGLTAFMMMTRLISYTIAFAQMAELLDATRLVMLSLFSKPGAGKPAPFKPKNPDTI
jgi:hypothetical protein